MQQKSKNCEGSVLAIIFVVLIAFSLIVLSLFYLSSHSAREAIYQEHSVRAFWLAEAARQWCVADLYAGGDGTTGPIQINGNPEHTYEVREIGSDENARYAIGTVNVGGRQVQRAIRVGFAYVAAPFDKAIHAGGEHGSEWTFQMRGAQYGTDYGPRKPLPGSEFDYKPGGNDVVFGDVAINGNILMDQDSRIFEYIQADSFGDLDVTGTFDISGNSDLDPTDGHDHTGLDADIDPAPNLATMQYHINHDYDLKAIFEANNVTSGRLPADHELYNVVRLRDNPSTEGLDFYFEPTAMSLGDPASAGGTIEMENKKVFYVDGHVWFDSSRTFGFEIDGQSTIVSTRDIHISDNLVYKNGGTAPVQNNPPDLLLLIALGQLDESGAYDGNGNIYFGDGGYGTTYRVDAFMFANNDFLYNTNARSGEQMEPSTGFVVNGNYMAVNTVTVLRDWYTDENGQRRAAQFDLTETPARWEDYISGAALKESQVENLRHYAMQVKYDARLKDPKMQVAGLPVGGGKIFVGLDSWREVAVP